MRIYPTQLKTLPLTFMNMIMICQKLSLLCIEIDLISMVPEFIKLIQCLPNLKSLYLGYPNLINYSLWAVNTSKITRLLLKEASLSSKLLFLCFQINFSRKDFASGTADNYSEFYLRRTLQEEKYEIKERVKIKTNVKLVRVFVR